VRSLVTTAAHAEWCAPGTTPVALLREGTIEANGLQAARDDAQLELAEVIRFQDGLFRVRRGLVWPHRGPPWISGQAGTVMRAPSCGRRHAGAVMRAPPLKAP